MTSPRIAVLGTGALGGYYGGLLARAGHHVHFVARSDHDHIARHGLRVDSVAGDFLLEDVAVHGSTTTVPSCDIVLVCVKTFHNPSAIPAVSRLLQPGGTVVLLQNGLGEEEAIAALPGVGRVVSALGFVCATKLGPGHIRHSDYGSLRLAQYADDRQPAGLTQELERIAQLFETAGVKASTEEDWLAARWRKLVWNVPFNGLSVAQRADTHQLVSHEPTRQVVRELMLEVVAAARAEARVIDPAFVDRMIDDTTRMRPYLPSMRIDFDEGRPLELDAMYRVPIERGRAAGVAMPHAAMLFAQLDYLVGARDGQRPAVTQKPSRKEPGPVSQP